MTKSIYARLAAIALVWGLAELPAASVGLAAQQGADAFAATLTDPQRKLFEDYLAARTLFDFKLDAYWREVSDKRTLRRGKKGRNEALNIKDYVLTYPPKYEGPDLPADIAKRWQTFQDQQEEEKKEEPPKPRPNIADFLAASKAEFGFVPEIIPEREFKLRYAREAKALGLTKDQVVRVYALETSGIGTADMLAGIHPIKKTGTPISTALGYAQLLAANSCDELVEHGQKFVERLRNLSADRTLDPTRRAVMADKAERVKAMIAAAKSVPHRWENHVAYARTDKGLGIHALNLDGDIGPWLQVVKLNGLKALAEKAGISALTGAQIELMNLAGPGTGLEMMRPGSLDAPTPNFFARDAYGRNTIVRDKTAKELLAALDKRMQENINNPGAVEFAAVFDQVAGEKRAGQN